VVAPKTDETFCVSAADIFRLRVVVFKTVMFVAPFCLSTWIF